MAGTNPPGPEQVFHDAQSAMGRGDLAAFFQCLDRKDLLRLGENAAGLLLGPQPMPPAVARLCDSHAIPSTAIDDLRALAREITESAQRIQSAVAAGGPVGSGQEHQLLVKRYQAGIVEMLQAISDLPAFLGEAESVMRSLIGGGFVSRTLLVGENLQDLLIEGNRAWGTRVGTTSSGTAWNEDVGFVRIRSGQWKIKLFAKRPRGKKPGSAPTGRR